MEETISIRTNTKEKHPPAETTETIPDQKSTPDAKEFPPKEKPRDERNQHQMLSRAIEEALSTPDRKTNEATPNDLVQAENHESGNGKPTRTKALEVPTEPVVNVAKVTDEKDDSTDGEQDQDHDVQTKKDELRDISVRKRQSKHSPKSLARREEEAYRYKDNNKVSKKSTTTMKPKTKSKPTTTTIHAQRHLSMEKKPNKSIADTPKPHQVPMHHTTAGLRIVYATVPPRAEEPHTTTTTCSQSLHLKHNMARFFSRILIISVLVSIWTMIIWYRDSWSGFVPNVTTKQRNVGANNVTYRGTQPQVVPKYNKTFIIAAGRGTTGTHAVFEATCWMGYPSIHWSLQCLDNEKHNKTNAAAKSHLKIMALTKAVEKCMAASNSTKCGNANRWKRYLLTHMNQLVMSDGLQALHDSPYPFFLSEFLPILKSTYSDVVVILSERDPTQYVDMRASKPYGRDDLICRPEHVAPFDAATLHGGLLDLGGCIDRATKGKEDTVDVRDVFVSLESQVDTIEGRHQVVQALAEWQSAVRRKARYSVDLFARPTKTTTKDLVQEIIVHGIRRIHEVRLAFDFLPRARMKGYLQGEANQWQDENRLWDSD